MGKIFGYDSGIMRFLNKLVDCVFLSVLWIVFSIPIFTFGASSTALYYTANKVIRRDRSHVWREFWGAFKTNFKQATIVWLFFMVFYWILGMNCIWMYQWQQKALLIFYAVFGVFITVWAIYLFALIARFENKTKVIMKNAGLMAVRHIIYSFILILMFVLAVIVSLMWWVLILILPAIYGVLASSLLEPVFRKYMSEEDLEAEDERNRDYYN